MFRITSFPTPVSPLPSVVSSPYKSALTPANNSLANASGVTHQRQGAKISFPNFQRTEMITMFRNLFQFMGEGLPLTSEGRFDLDHVVQVARQKAENSKNSSTVSKLWWAVATLIDPKINKDLAVVINENTKRISITSNQGFAGFKEFQSSEFYQPQNYAGISVENYYTFSEFKRGAKRTEHLKGLNSLNRLLSDYQAYLDSLETESPLS
jgi:hypothetical protein